VNKTLEFFLADCHVVCLHWVRGLAPRQKDRRRLTLTSTCNPSDSKDLCHPRASADPVPTLDRRVWKSIVKTVSKTVIGGEQILWTRVLSRRGKWVPPYYVYLEKPAYQGFEEHAPARIHIKLTSAHSVTIGEHHKRPIWRNFHICFGIRYILLS